MVLLFTSDARTNWQTSYRLPKEWAIYALAHIHRGLSFVRIVWCGMASAEVLGAPILRAALAEQLHWPLAFTQCALQFVLLLHVGKL